MTRCGLRWWDKVAGSKKITLGLLDTTLAALINASAKIFPVAYTYVSAGTNPDSYEYVRVLEVGDHRNEIYVWRTDTNAWELIGADDSAIVWDDVTEKPTVFTPDTHTHVKADVTDFAHTHDYAAPDHNHDSAYAAKSTETAVSGLDTRVTTLEGGSGHTHTNQTALDKIVYTGAETSVDLKGIANNATAIEGKADSGHTHTKTDVTDFTHTHTKSEVTDFTHAHTKSEVTDFTHTHTVSEVTDFAHTHDDRYYTEAEITTTLAGKADSSALTGHTGNTTAHVTADDKTLWNGLDSRVTTLEGGTGHTHTNQSVLDLLGESLGELTYNGNPITGSGAANLTLTTLTLGNFQIHFNSVTDKLEVNYVV